MGVIGVEAPADVALAKVAGGARLRLLSPQHLLLFVQTAVLIAMAGSVATRIWQDHVWVGYALVAGAIVCWAPEFRRARARRWWFVYVAGTFAYTLLRSYADETRIPIQTMYPIDIDRALSGASSLSRGCRSDCSRPRMCPRWTGRPCLCTGRSSWRRMRLLPPFSCGAGSLPALRDARRWHPLSGVAALLHCPNRPTVARGAGG